MKCEYLIKINNQLIDDNLVIPTDIKIIENISYKVPLLEMTLRLVNSDFANNLYDGVVIEVKLLFQNNTSSKNYRFRLYNISKIVNYTYYTEVVLSAKLDIYNILSVEYKSYKLSSSEVISSIANRLKLKYVGESTFDKMTWINPGYTPFQFSYDVEMHGYVNDKSCMSLFYGPDQVLYKDINKQLTSSYLYNFVESTDANGQDIPYLASKISIESGLMNQLWGYGRNVYNFSYLNGSTNTISNDISVNKVTDNVEVNRDLKKVQKSVPTPIDCGNTHSNYNKAKYQNLKYKSLFSVTNSIQVANYLNLSVMDPVNFNLLNQKSIKSLKQYDGKYIIESISHTRDEKGIYYGFYKLVRTGVNKSDSISTSNNLY